MVSAASRNRRRQERIDQNYHHALTGLRRVRLGPQRMGGSIRWRMRDSDWLPAGMLAIVVSATLVILALLVTVLWLSFTASAPGNPKLIYTAGNFREVFFDARTYGALLNTLGFSTISLAVALLFGL